MEILCRKTQVIAKRIFKYFTGNEISQATEEATISGILSGFESILSLPRKL